MALGEGLGTAELARRLPAALIATDQELYMGISDRDWYRDELNRRERPFGRGRSPARGSGFAGSRHLFARPGIP